MAEDAKAEVKQRNGPLGINLVRVAALYMLGGLALGIAIGVSKNFALLSAHGHVLLLGWTTMAITGLVYIAVPACERSRLARVHAWVHNLGLPVLTAGLVLGERGQPLTVTGSLLVFAALLVFALNIFINGSKRPRWSESAPASHNRKQMAQSR